MTTTVAARRRVTILALGGTIASVPSGAQGVAPGLEGSDLVAAVPGLDTVAEITSRTVARLPGAHLTIDDLVSLASAAEGALRSGADGVVVTQGTDTMEDTAFVLDLLVGGPAPVVVTGAMRNPGLPGADGPANLLSAVAVAVDPSTRDVGTLVVMNDEIHAARFVGKRHSQNPSAFVSSPGPIGWIAEGRPHIALRPIGRRLIPHPDAGNTRHVAGISLGLGDDGSLVDAAAARADGLVVEALGGGHVPPAALGALEKAAHRIPVVLTSTTRAGEVLRTTYDFPGSEIDLAARGLVNGGMLDARKARLLLTLLLRTGADRNRVTTTFADPWPAEPTGGSAR